jgi:transposase
LEDVINRYIEGADRNQVTLFPDRLEDWIDEDNAVRVIDAFVDGLDLIGLGFERATAAATGRPGYHPAVLLKLYVYGYLNRVQSSRRLEREAGRNVEVLWLLGRLAPDHKTIADFRRDNGAAIRKCQRRFKNLPLWRSKSRPLGWAPWGVMQSNGKHVPRRVCPWANMGMS